MSARTMNARYVLLMGALWRLDKWAVAAHARARKEAESAIGSAFDGCVWHNASLSYACGRPWPTWGRNQERAYRRFLHLQRHVWDTKRALTDSLYHKAIAALNGAQS